MSSERRFHLICDEEGCRLDVYLSRKLSITRTKAKDLIKEGYVHISGTLPKSSTKLKRLLHIEGEIPEEEPMTLEPQDIPLEILYEDEFFLAVNKPQGMVVHPSFGHHKDTLVNAVLAYLEKGGSGGQRSEVRGQRSEVRGQGTEDRGQKTEDRGQGTEDRGQKTEDRGQKTEVRGQKAEGRGQRTEVRGQRTEVGRGSLEFGGWREGEDDRNGQFAMYNSYLVSFRPGIVHRLDKDTTGVILVAKDSKTQEMISALFKERNVRKTYRAVVEETIAENGLTIEGNIGRHPIDRKKMAVLKDGGRSAYTEMRVIERLDGFTYVEVYPKTGRTHQIRVHLSHIGHPIVGDIVYGRRARLLTKRPFLHAYRIEFIHPVNNAPIFIEAPVPDDVEEFVKSKKREERTEG
jgi:23S rRNA-/tRNA-specific pseudouridylate synthase